MRAPFLMLIPILAAGCSSDPTVTATNASVEEVQKQVAKAGGRMEMRPGRWEGTMTVKNTVPAGVPAAAGNATQPLKVCITADQIRPGADPMVSQMQEGCKYDTFKMANGRIDATMTCERPGITLKNKINGEFTADTYKLTSVAEATGETVGPMAGMKAESTIDARRTGECKGDENKG